MSVSFLNQNQKPNLVGLVLQKNYKVSLWVLFLQMRFWGWQHKCGRQHGSQLWSYEDPLLMHKVLQCFLASKWICYLAVIQILLKKSWYYCTNFFSGWLMFQSLDEHSPMRYHVYYHLVQVAKQVDQVQAVFKDVDHLKQQFAACPPSNEQMQKLLRLLHEVLLGCKQRFVFKYLVH